MLLKKQTLCSSLNIVLQQQTIRDISNKTLRKVREKNAKYKINSTKSHDII